MLDQAAMTTARALGKRTVLLERSVPGSQETTSTEAATAAATREQDEAAWRGTVGRLASGGA